MRTQFRKESFFSVPKKDVFAFHERPDAFSLLTRKSDDIDVISTASTLKPSDDVVRFVAHFLFLKFHFAMFHTEYEPYDLFVDEQKEGLFSSWRHEHRFTEAGWDQDPASMLSDRIEFAHPLLPFFAPFVKHRLKGMFAYRHEITAREVHGDMRSKHPYSGSKVIVTGATGLIGKRVSRILQERGVEVTAFVRDVERARKILDPGIRCVLWDFHDPGKGDWSSRLKDADAVIHLAGTPLFKQRWTRAFKEEMEQSRVTGTRQLVDAIRASSRRPGAFVSASAVGIYGMNPEIEADEETPPGDDLLSRICVNWEREVDKLEGSGVRPVKIRIGIVLSTEAGAVKEMLPLFKTGMGGVLGYPHHWINWIHLEDMARIFVMAAFNETMSGPYNAAAPQPVQMKTFAQTLAQVLHRPAVMRFPAPMMKLIIGEAGEYSSGGPKATGSRIRKAGYRFFFDELAPALRNVLL